MLQKKHGWLIFLPVFLTWCFIIALPIGTVNAIRYYEPTWPKIVSWFVGAITLLLLLLIGEWLNRGMYTFFGYFTKKP